MGAPAGSGTSVQPAAMPQQPSVFQQSAASLGQTQRTLTGLSEFTPQQMAAAQAGPTALTQGAKAGPTATYSGATIAPIERASAAQLGPAQTMQSVGAVQAAQAPEQIAVDQLRTMDISQYMNPYTQQVIEAGQADIERQRQLASDRLGAQATAAKAFGGSRQAVQEGILAGEALRQAGQLSAQQRQAGFQQAIQSGQFDIGQMQAARTLASQQGFQAEQLGQQAREAAAAREQAARAGNMQAANQFATQQAQLEQQAAMANQAAFNARAVQQAGLTQAAGLSNQAAINQAVQAQAARNQAAGMSNQAALNAAAQSQAARQQAANAANFQGQFTGAGVRQGAAGGLASLGQQQFNIGTNIQQQQSQQGLLQQGLQQALIDAARGQYSGFTGAPAASLAAPLSALGVTPNQSTTTTTQRPGLFNYLQAFAGMG